MGSMPPNTFFKCKDMNSILETVSDTYCGFVTSVAKQTVGQEGFFLFFIKQTSSNYCFRAVGIDVNAK